MPPSPQSPLSLQSVGIVDLVDADPRPTFVVALSSPDGSPTCRIVHENLALTTDATLHQAVLDVPQNSSHAHFWDWVSSATAGPKRPPSAALQSLSYLGVYWTRSLVLGKWIVMNANEMPPSVEPPRKIRLEAVEDGGGGRTQHSEPVSTTQSIDFAALDKQPKRRLPVVFRTQPDTGLQAPDFMPDAEPFLDVILSVDWDSNSLGAMDEWPVRLQQAFNQTIPDSRAIAIYWGPEYLAIYNEAFSKFCGRNHPRLLGGPVTETWPHLQEQLDHLWTCPPQKRSKIENESRFFIEKADGTLEETYVKWALTPIIESRKCVGVQHSLIETTSMRLWERRMKMLIELGDALVTARDVKSYWTKTIEELERWSPHYDVPLAFIYSVGEDDDTDSSLSRYDCPRICHLEGSLGVPAGHPIAPETLELRDTDDGLAPSFREALKTQYALLIQTKNGTLPEKHLAGLKWRGFGDACKEAVICPIRPTRDENVMGILFLGLNPRRTYDNDYRQFISLLNQKLTSSLASTVLLEEEARRGRNAAEQAAYDRAMLQRKLVYQTEQANQSIQNFQAVAEFIPVGMSFVDNQGNVTFANDAFFRITGTPSGRMAAGALLECALPEDKQKILDAYENLKKMDVVTYEFRIAPSRIRKNSSLVASAEHSEGRVNRHVLASTKAERAHDGSVVRMLTCLTDVTEQKDTAEEAVRRAQQAENLKRLAEFATVGMYDINLDGRLLSANNLFWEFCGLPKVDLTKVKVEPWPECVVEEDLPALQHSLDRLKHTGKPQTAEIRLKTTWSAEVSSGDTIVAPRSVLATFMPVKSSTGVIQSFTGCLSDVSLQKWQLEQEKLRKEEAIDSRRQQENFIDMTSHEMRNPLSAILHCTDAIIASLSHFEDLDDMAMPLTPSKTSAKAEQSSPSPGSTPEMKKLLKDSIENAETIVTCAQHQKRIVDDILTMSKLDSKLLAVTPCTVNPIHIVKDALKMFEVEARRVDIALTSVVDQSYTDLGFQFLDLDPSRVKQVLINLLTNALKFTKTGKLRNVEVSVKASLTPPGRNMSTTEFIPRFCDVAEEYEQPALRGRKNPVYLLFEVKDTGQGLTSQEMSTLFNKFVQASAKTHVKYGGSGLGLFISRRLTELQNGAIGVSSRAGVGSTFAFYIEAYVPTDDALKEAEAMDAAAKLVAGTEHNSEQRRAGVPRELSLQSRQNPAGNIRLDGILVVEDNLINQQITRRGLTERGYAVDVANHGIEALEKLRRSVGANARVTRRTRAASIANSAQSGASRSSRSPGPHSHPIPISLVLMDIEMPVQDGLTCTRHLRELEQKGEVFCASGGKIPIVAVTANARPEQITEAKAAGCDDVLVKPYRIPELVEKMQVVIRRIGGLSPNSPVR